MNYLLNKSLLTMRYYIIVCAFVFLNFDAFSQSNTMFRQKNDLNQLIKESISSALTLFAKDKNYYLNPRRTTFSYNVMWLDTVFLSIDNLPYQIELESIPGIRYYSDMGSMRQAFTNESLYRLGHPVITWHIDHKIVGKYLTLIIAENFFRAHRRRFIKEVFRFAPYVQTVQGRYYHRAFEYDYQSGKWIESDFNFVNNKIKNDKNIINIIISETITDFVERLISNNVFSTDCYSAISIDGLPLSYDNTTPESYWDHFVDELNLSHNVALGWYKFVDINNSNFTNKSYKNKILNGSHIIAPQICLNGDNLIITISYRKIDAKGYYDKLLAIGRYLYTLDSKSTNGEWKIKNNLFELTVP